VGATISTMDCETILDVSEIEIGNLRILQDYVDADYARDLDQRRSTTGYVFTVAECVISGKAEL